MNFKNFFNKDTKETNDFKSIDKKIVNEDTEKEIEKIRKSGLKIKNIHPTKFGTEVVFFKEADAEEAFDLTIGGEVDGKSIFIPKGK